jgi:hypothetical protein
LAGEIQIWRGAFLDIPAEESRLMQNFESQIARALERTQQPEKDMRVNGLTPKASTK